MAARTRTRGPVLTSLTLTEWKLELEVGFRYTDQGSVGAVQIGDFPREREKRTGLQWCLVRAPGAALRSRDELIGRVAGQD